MPITITTTTTTTTTTIITSITNRSLVNGPKWMSVVLKIAKTFLPKSTSDKIDIFSSVPKLLDSEFGANILRRDKLPAFLGGDVPDSALPPELTGELIARDEEQAYVNKPC